MRLFGRKGGRECARPPLVRNFATATQAGWPRSYEQQIRSAYMENGIAQRAVRLVAEGVGSISVQAGDNGGDAVRLIGATNAGQSLMETAALHLLLHGNSFIQIVQGADGAPAALYALRPERVTIEPGADGWPVAYRYRAGNRTSCLPAQDSEGRATVVHVKALHPMDDHYGMGCLSAAAGAIAIHNAATEWNKALLDNAARPSGALLYDPPEAGATLTPEQFDRLRAELEASFAGAGNAGRPMLLEGGLKWQALSLTPADMDFVGLKAAAAREIALTFGVPPLLLGLPGDNSYANYSEANRAIWRQTILPMADKILNAISQGLQGWWADLALSADRDSIPALAEDRERLWSQLAQADFLSRSEKRAMVGLSTLEQE